MMDLFFKPNRSSHRASGTPGKLGYVIIKNIADSDFSRRGLSGQSKIR